MRVYFAHPGTVGRLPLRVLVKTFCLKDPLLHRFTCTKRGLFLASTRAPRPFPSAHPGCGMHSVKS